MNKRKLLCVCLLAALLSCGCIYHPGGIKNRGMRKVNSICVNTFANHTLIPYVATQFSSALTETLQRDGDYRLASPSECDAVLTGTVTSVRENSLRTDWRNTYISAEIGLTVQVSYTVTDARTGRILTRGQVSEEGSYFNDPTGNIQAARDSALSYATRLAAEQIVLNLTTP